jgi:tRNA (Thr-GGU) A37 N-methylase
LHVRTFRSSARSARNGEWGNDVRLTPIGTIRTAFPQAAGTPIQPYRARGTSGFERIRLVYWFHRASPAKMRVVPYRDTVEHGVFATRAPARPNPIGISCVRLLAVEGNVLRIAEVDVRNTIRIRSLVAAGSTAYPTGPPSPMRGSNARILKATADRCPRA